MTNSLLVAAAHATHPGRALLLVLLVAAAGYYLACQIWPYTNCGTCGGSGHRPSPSGRGWRPCRHCAGTGARRRLLARARRRR